MRYEPFVQDGRWWFGVTHKDRPRYRTGFCASSQCAGHEYPHEARAHMREWLLSRMIPCEFMGAGVCQAEHLHLFAATQRELLELAGRRGFGWVRRLLPLVTTLGYACQSHAGLSVRLCQSHRSAKVLRAVLPQPEEVLQ